MIDMHTHILPGLDDGPDSMDISIEMVQLAAEDGIQAMIATPHARSGKFDSSPEIVKKGMDALNIQLTDLNIPVTIYPGMEIHICDDIQKRIENNELLTLNHSRYVLIELPGQLIPPKFKEVIFQLKLQGYYPILAHPERNFAIQKSPDMINDFIDWGVYIQITAASLMGQFGIPLKQLSKKMLQNRQVHFIASDTHTPYSRPPILSEACQLASKILKDKTEARALVDQNPKNVIDNQLIEFNEPVVKKRWFLWG